MSVAVKRWSDRGKRSKKGRGSSLKTLSQFINEVTIVLHGHGFAKDEITDVIRFALTIKGIKEVES